MSQPMDPAQRLADKALALDADRARPFDAGRIVIQERVRLKCLTPLCPAYGVHLMCPPNLPSVDWFRKVVSQYKRALLIQVISRLEQPRAGEAAALKPEAKEDAFASAIFLHKIVGKVEQEAMTMGYPLAAGLIAGHCRLCLVCVGQGSDQPCPQPGKARPSMEAMGIDVVATAAAAGLPLKFPAKEEVVWTGLILVD